MPFRSIHNTTVPKIIIKAFFPKNRGSWKRFSSWKPEIKDKKGRKGRDEVCILTSDWRQSQPSQDETGEDLSIKNARDIPWSRQVGITVVALVEKGKQRLVDWTKEVQLFSFVHR